MPFVKAVLNLAAMSLMLGLIAGWLGTWHPALDSFSHFRFHLMVLLVMTIIILFALSQRPVAMLGLIVFATSAFLMKSHLPLPQTVPENLPGKAIKLMQLNILFRNESYSHVAKVVLNSGADIVAFQEVTRKTGKVLELIEKDYPHQLSCAFRSVGSVSLVSRHPFSGNGGKLCMRANGFAKADFVINGTAITVASIHLHWPWPYNQPSQIRRLKPALSALSGPLLIAGDFNAAPWSAAVKRVAEFSRTRISTGYLPTWGLGEIPKSWIKKFGLQIDNTLYSDDFEQVDRQRLLDAKSDHFPVMTTFVLKQ